jgi:hypothetical protein
MSAQEYDPSGVLRKQWNDATRTFTAWNAAGQQTSTRPYTAAENARADALAAAAAADQNASTIKAQVAAAITANKAYVALANPTTAQTTAQVKALSRQLNGVMRLLTGQLDATD